MIEQRELLLVGGPADGRTVWISVIPDALLIPVLEKEGPFVDHAYDSQTGEYLGQR